MNVELARALYFRELDTRVQQDAKIGTHITALSATGAGLFYLVSNSWPAETDLCRASLVLAGISAIAFLGAVTFVLRAAVGFDYEQIPWANDVLGYWRNISKHYEAYPQTPGSPDRHFDDFLLRHLAAAATRNGEIGQVRAARFHHAGMCLIAVVILAAASAFTLGVDRAILHSQRNRSSGMTDQSNKPNPAQLAATPAAPPAAEPVAAVPPLPPEPPNIIVKGGAERGVALTPAPTGLRGAKKP